MKYFSTPLSRISSQEDILTGYSKTNRIKIGDFGDDHWLEAIIPGMDTYVLKYQFLKKV